MKKRNKEDHDTIIYYEGCGYKSSQPLWVMNTDSSIAVIEYITAKNIINTDTVLGLSDEVWYTDEA